LKISNQLIPKTKVTQVKNMKPTTSTSIVLKREETVPTPGRQLLRKIFEFYSCVYVLNEIATCESLYSQRMKESKNERKTRRGIVKRSSLSLWKPKKEEGAGNSIVSQKVEFIQEEAFDTFATSLSQNCMYSFFLFSSFVFLVLCLQWNPPFSPFVTIHSHTGRKLHSSLPDPRHQRSSCHIPNNEYTRKKMKGETVEREVR